MSEPVKGVVTYQGKRLTISWMAKKGMAVPNMLEKSVARTKRVDAFAQSGSLDVLVELVGGRPFRVWCPDEKPPDIPVVTPASAGERSHGPGEEKYHNPYNFIPAVPRDTLPIGSDLADRAPADHDTLGRELWTGRLRIRMQTETPLLIPDVARDPDADHKVYPLRLGADGRPLVPPTSVKGMLRSAYEAVTNSRMGVFSAHEVPLGMRRDSHSGLDMVPVRVVQGSGDTLQAELQLGTTEIDPNRHGSPLDPDRGKQCSTMYAAWLPAYHRNDDVKNMSSWKHGDEVKSFLAVSRSHGGNARFDYWQVVPDDYEKKPDEELRGFKDGRVCISGKNMPPGTRKHDERIFFNSNGKVPVRLPVTDEQVERWKNLIEDYYRANENDILKAPCPPALGRGCEYSRHIRNWKKESRLEAGTLCYATVKWEANALELVNLYPVMISRDLQDASPDELLDAGLHPATDIDHLSPADRVFGWVKDGAAGSKKSSAYRGNLRVGQVRCETEDAIELLSGPGLDGLPLAIMGQPKPEQARFYGAKDQQGNPQRSGLEKKDSIYAPGKGLRGRKVYPHQNVPDGYWNSPQDGQTQAETVGSTAWYREYRRPQLGGKEQLDTQNRTVEAWVRPGSVFSFDIDVANLSDVEFGALLWILSLGEKYYLRFGGGKAYGFGSVALLIDWAKSQFGQGVEWAAYYSSLVGTLPAGGQQRAAKIISKYQEAVAAAARTVFEQAGFIKAFIVAARGYADGLPTHYPRSRKRDDPSTVPPKPAGEGFKWFVENERVAGGHRFNGLALPDLATDDGLPYLEEYERPRPR
jgi:CRISPR-associated protein (TIGR03986 family)